MPVSEAVKVLGTTPGGLNSEEAERRLDEYGPNELSHTRHVGFFADILHRCKSPLVIQLLVIAVVSGVIGEIRSSFIVGAMVLLSVGLSYVLDNRSNRAVESLGKRVQSRTVVLRDGAAVEIRISEVVPGDVVLLQAGSLIPGDLRLFWTKDFFVSQSALSGESMAVEKTADAEDVPRHSALELPNACFLGTTATSGSARGLVINTGAHTIFGAISERLAGEREETASTRASVPLPGS